MTRKKHEVKRLLCIVSSLNVGGAETFLMKIYRALDKRKYQMDFYCMSLEKGYYENEVKQMGGRVFHSHPKSKHFLKSIISLMHTVKKEKYSYVIRVSQHSLSTIDLLSAKLGGAKVLVQRSTNADSASFFSRQLHSLFKWLPKIVPTIKVAPSTESAEYTFGKNAVEKGEVKIIKNALAVDDYTFCSERRNCIREKFGIQNKFVVGHVGRFAKQKNHYFLIKVFSEIVKRHSNSILLLIGTGELEQDLREEVEKFNLSDKVIFTGVRSDIPDLMMAMDVFVFPSLYEGMPNTVIEAQATGLPCIISDTITREAKITELVEYLPIDAEVETWAECALKNKDLLDRKDMKKELIKNGYEIVSVTRNLEHLIFN